MKSRLSNWTSFSSGHFLLVHLAVYFIDWWHNKVPHFQGVSHRLEKITDCERIWPEDVARQDVRPSLTCCACRFLPSEQFDVLPCMLVAASKYWNDRVCDKIICIGHLVTVEFVARIKLVSSFVHKEIYTGYEIHLVHFNFSHVLSECFWGRKEAISFAIYLPVK